MPPQRSRLLPATPFQCAFSNPCPKGAIDLVDKLSLLETVALLNQCCAAIVVDSGLLHLALATDVALVPMFTVVHPWFRLAWRGSGYNHKLAIVPPAGECIACSHYAREVVTDYRHCPYGEVPLCMPDVEDVYGSFANLMSLKNQPSTQGGVMQPSTVNPDVIVQQAIQAKLNVYQAKEHFEAVLKSYNDQVDSLVNLVSLMKNRILELEREVEVGKAREARSATRELVGSEPMVG